MASCLCLKTAQASALHVRHHTDTAMTWAAAVAGTATNFNDEDVGLARPIHVIAGQLISLFLFVVFRVVYVSAISSMTESWRTSTPGISIEWQGCNQINGAPSHDGTVDSHLSTGQTLGCFILRISSFACLLLHYFLRLPLFSLFALLFRYCILTLSHVAMAPVVAPLSFCATYRRMYV